MTLERWPWWALGIITGVLVAASGTIVAALVVVVVRTVT